jgi:hypothetical protein
MQLAEWILDVGLYGVDVEFARDAFLAMKAMLVRERESEQGGASVGGREVPVGPHPSMRAVD